jgi:hypothetical protein
MGRTKKLLCAVAICATAVVGVSASAAFAGEVIGPPGSVENPPTPKGERWDSLPHSICAFSGLNDFTVGEGAVDFHVQSYGIDVSGQGDPADPHFFNPGDVCRQGPGLGPHPEP